MPDTTIPTRTTANPQQHKPQRKALEQEHSFENLKSIGLKAGVLALMAGLAFYPKISAEAEVVEREMRAKRERKDVFRSERRRGVRDRESERDRYGYAGGRSEREDRESNRYEERERERDGDRSGDRSGDRRRDGGRVMRVNEYDARRGEGYRERDRAREQGSVRSRGGSRTQQWVEGGYEYLNVNDYEERDRRRW